MHKSNILILTFLALFLTINNYALADTMKSESLSSATLDPRIYHIELIQTPHEKYTIIASGKHVYINASTENTWDTLYTTNKEAEIIQDIAVLSGDTTILYIATTKDVYGIDIHNRETHNLLSIDTQKKERITSLAVNPDINNTLVIGTTDHLSFVHTAENIWHTHTSDNASHIHDILFHPTNHNILLILTHKEVLSYDMQNKTIMARHAFPALSTDENILDPQKTHHIIPSVSHIETLFIVREKNMYKSTDAGFHWNFIISSDSILHATDSLSSSDTVFSTDDRLFIIDKDDHIKKLHTPLTATHIYACLKHETDPPAVYVGTNRGLFRLQAERDLKPVSHIPLDPQDISAIQSIFHKEPSIGMLHTIAIDYANVDRNKTIEWYRNAKLSGMLPKLSFSYDTHNEDSIDIDRGSTSADDVYIFGPDQEEYTWEMSCQWDLSHLIWNDDATAIDYREKYMVERREEILQELTRLYFERRKLQITYYCSPPKDTQSHLELSLRIDELTAHIDALTGGAMTEHLLK